MVDFQILFPGSLTEAVSILSEYGEDAKLIAGGQSLVPTINLGLFAPKRLVDLARIPGLSKITAGGGRLSIGSMVTHANLAASSVVQRRCPVLAEAAGQIGDVQIRSRGTIGGSLSHADPAADYPAVALAIEASMQVFGPKGERTIPAEKFFVDVFQTSMEPVDVLTRILVPDVPPHSGSAYEKLVYVHGAFPVVGCAAVVTMNGNCLKRVSIGLTGIGAAPLKPHRAERSLEGRAPSPRNLDRAAALAAEATRPTSDLHASSEYKREMVRVFTRRALHTAIARAMRGAS